MQGQVAPARPDMRGALPLCTPLEQALRPTGESLCGAGSPTPHDAGAPPYTVTFPSRGSHAGAPGAAPLGTRWCEVSALFALAYASRRAGFCHRRRWICHFEVVGGIGCAVSLGFEQEKYSASIRGAGAFSCTFGCNFGGDSGIGEGGFWKRTGNEVAETEGTEGDSIR